MKTDNLRKFVEFAWDFILDMPGGLESLPEDWEIDQYGENMVVEAAFQELEDIENHLKDDDVAHSRWVYEQNSTTLYCVRCGSAHGGGFSYCSYCGAKMNARDKEDDTK